jgi:hypothetical protein
MANTRRHIIVGYAVFTLLFLSGIFVFTLFRIDLLSMKNEKTVDDTLKSLGYDLKLLFSDKGNFEETKMSDLFDRALSNEPRLLVVALISDNGIIRAKGVSKEYVVDADLGTTLGKLEYKKPLGTSVKEMNVVLEYRNVQLPGRPRLSALYISFSKKDSVVLFEEILYILLGFFGLTLIMIIVTAVLSRRDEKALQRALAPDMPLDLPSAPPPAAPRPAPRTPVDEGLAAPPRDLEWSEEEREARKRERFSEITGLVKRDFLRERLAAEIERAVSFNEDMALILISLEVEDGAAWKVHLVPIIHRLFGNPDMAHEYGPNAAAIIAPGMDIDTAIKSAQLLYRQISDRKLKTCMGISTRNGRSLTPAIFTEEASQALAQAESGTQSPIIAFRSDADRYSDYMQKK